MKANLIKSLEDHEGFKGTPYKDHLGHETIGIGHKLANPISKKAARQILLDDIDMAIMQLHKIIPYWHAGLSGERQNVIIEMAFQMGATGVSEFKKMWKAIKLGDWELAAAEMLDSQWHKQTPKRAKELADRMLEG